MRLCTRAPLLPLLPILALWFVPFSAPVGDVGCSNASTHGCGDTVDRRLKDNDSRQDFVYCRISVLTTIFEPLGLAPDIVDRQASTTCCIPIVNDTEQDHTYEISLPTFILSSYQTDLYLGRLLVNITNATIGATARSVELGPSVKFSIVEAPNDLVRRSKQLSTGVKSLALVHVSILNATPEYSAATLRRVYFDDTVNLATQLEGCSSGRLQLKPIDLYEIELDQSADELQRSDTPLIDAVLDHMKDTMNLTLVSTLADVVVFCLPPTSTATNPPWAATSVAFHWRIQKSSAWCISLSTAMRAMVHLLGGAAVPHSLVDGDRDDTNATLQVRNAILKHSDGPRVCYSAVEHWKLGWFRSRTLRINPLRQHGASDSDSDGRSHIVQLAAVTDYALVSNNWDDESYVLIVIADRWIVQYNRAKNFNVDTAEFPDEVTVTDNLGIRSSTSNVSVRGLNVGDDLELADKDEFGMTLRVAVCSSIVGTSSSPSGITPDVMIVLVVLGDDMVCGQNDNQRSSPWRNGDEDDDAAPSPGVSNSSTSPSSMPTTAASSEQPVYVLWRSLQVVAISGLVSLALGSFICCFARP